MTANADTTRPPAPPSIASDLKRICSYWPNILNSRDIAHASPEGQQVAACVDSAFEARIDGYAETFDWNGLLGVWQKEVTQFPECRLELADIHAIVDEKNGTGTVYLELDMIGLANVTLKGFTEVTWLRTEEGKWMMHRFNGVRGHVGNTGFV